MSKSATEPCSSGSLRAVLWLVARALFLGGGLRGLVPIVGLLDRRTRDVLWDLAQESAGRFSGATGTGSLDGQSDFNTGQFAFALLGTLGAPRTVRLRLVDGAATVARACFPVEPFDTYCPGRARKARPTQIKVWCTVCAIPATVAPASGEVPRLLCVAPKLITLSRGTAESTTYPGSREARRSGGLRCSGEQWRGSLGLPM